MVMSIIGPRETHDYRNYNLLDRLRYNIQKKKKKKEVIISCSCSFNGGRLGDTARGLVLLGRQQQCHTVHVNVGRLGDTARGLVPLKLVLTDGCRRSHPGP